MLNNKIGRSIFVSLLLASCIPIIVFVSYQINRNYKANCSSAVSKTISANQNISKEIGKYFSETNSSLVFLGKNALAQKSGDRADARDKKRNDNWKSTLSNASKLLKDKYPENTAIRLIYSDNNRINCFSFKNNAPANLSSNELKEAGKITDYLKRKSIYISNIESNIKMAISAGDKNSKIRGTLIAEVPLANILKIVKNSNLSFIMDDSGNCMSTKESFSYKISSEEYNALLVKKQGIIEKSDNDILVYNEIKLPMGKKWLLLQFIGKNELYASADKIKYKSIVLLVLSLIIIAFVIRFLARILYKPIHLASDYDSLTLAYNRKYFNELINAEIKKSKKTEKIFSIALLDIDYFKKINDEYGHQAGDFALKKTVEIIKGNLRKNDIVARYGGEEFAIMLNTCNKENAFELMERLRKLISEYEFSPNEYIRFNMTVSIGIAEYFPGIKNVKQVIEKADFLLYIAKNYGRNQVQK